jgi:serine protease Do
MRGIGEVSERLRRSTVQILSGKRQAFGSGVVWNADGLILTNAHVARHGQAEVQLWDGRMFPARVTARDFRQDMAALRIPPGDLEPVAPGDSAAVQPGQLVIAVGSPFGFAGAVSTGVVHSIGAIPGMGSRRWIRADVQLAPGNSGGPLADAGGRLIGINTAIVHGLGIAALSNDAAAFLRRGPRPSLGVTLSPVSLGLRILDIEPDGAAEYAALRAGDILLTSLDALGEALDSGNETLRLRFLRGDGGPVRETVVRLEARAVAA